MPRYAPLVLLVSVAVGLGLGVYLGWVVFPVQSGDAPPAALEQSIKDDYVLMVAAAWAGDGDRQAAQARLDSLDVDNSAEVRAAAARLAGAGYNAADLERLEALAQALEEPEASPP